MVGSRKRGRAEMEAPEVKSMAVNNEPSLLERLRNTWEFANLAQWIFIFGKAVKIDENLDIEDLEMECLKPHSTVLTDVGLALLKFVSSHRGLTPDVFDEYTRRQYVARAPSRNVFGTEEEPARFIDFDIFEKIRVLQQLTQWALVSPDRIREKMEEQREADQQLWRIEPFGWDAEDRTYVVLDDNRLYRQTEPPAQPEPQSVPKRTSKKGKAASRASKRRRVSAAVASEDEANGEEAVTTTIPVVDNGLGGATWECLAVTLDELNGFIISISKTRDPNEKDLRDRLTKDLLPLLEKQEESRKRKEAQKQRELLNIEKLASAKRSSRIAGKLEQQKQEEEAREAEEKRRNELMMARKEQERWIKLEQERESRMQTREQRLKERDARRILHEQELRGLSEDSKRLETGEGRLSERHLKLEIEKKRQALEELGDDEDWVFDCICGAYGQIDDGSHSVACEKCNIWQHTKCVGISEAAAGRDDFHFICMTCKRREKEAEDAKNRPIIKIKLNRPTSSSSQPVVPNETNGTTSNEHAVSVTDTRHLVDTPPQPARSAKRRSQSPNQPLPQALALAAHSQTPRLLPDISTTHHSLHSPSINSSPSKDSFDRAASSNSTTGSPTLGLSPVTLPRPISTQAYNFGSKDEDMTIYDGIPHGSPTKHVTLGSSPVPVQTPRPLYANGSSLANQVAVPKTLSNGGPDLHGNGGSGSPFSSNSPLAGAPVLMPSPKYAASALVNGHTNGNDAHQVSTHISAPANSFSTPGPRSAVDDIDVAHLSALPPPSTGISPIKHSPPLPHLNPASSVLRMGLTTPSVIPPVDTLSPSPPQQNLTPPIKHMESNKPKISFFPAPNPAG